MNKRISLAFMSMLLSLGFCFALQSLAEDAAPLEMEAIPLDSPAFVFSPGNWTGDEGRAGKLFRQTWNTGAYFTISWKSSNPQPAAKLLLDVSSYTQKFKTPLIAYSIDGVWKSRVPCANEIVIDGLNGAGTHTLNFCLHWTEQMERWGSEGSSGLNVLRITGFQVDKGSSPIPAAPASKWALIIGDSITEGVGTSELAPYSQLIGQALLTQGYEYCISACGWSGWLRRGDNPPGDVPGYYAISNGKYDDNASRWNKIDGNNHSLLDSKGHISAYGHDGQEPALIFINYGTNDNSMLKSVPADVFASIVQSLAALRKSAPNAKIVLLIPFGQYCAKEIKDAVEAHKKSHLADSKVSIIDLGPGVANALAVKNGVLGGLHPNDRGHAIFAARIIPQLMTILSSSK